MIDENRYHTYCYSDNRVIAYDKILQKNISYPRVIMEDYLQRKLLKTEEVHHIDGNPLNNDISNLCVMTRKEHLKLHGQLHYHAKYFDKIAICEMCGKEFLWTAKQQRSFNSNKHQTEKKGGIKHGPFCSRECSGIHGTLIQYNRI